MAEIKKSEESNRVFIGRAWVNKSKQNPEVEYLNVQIDRGFESITLNQNDLIQLYPNKKREGKKDADYRLSIVSNAKNQ